MNRFLKKTSVGVIISAIFRWWVLIILEEIPSIPVEVLFLRFFIVTIITLKVTGIFLKEFTFEVCIVNDFGTSWFDMFSFVMSCFGMPTNSWLKALQISSGIVTILLLSEILFGKLLWGDTFPNKISFKIWKSLCVLKLFCYYSSFCMTLL